MKKPSYLLAVIIILALSACEKVVFDEDGNTSGKSNANLVVSVFQIEELPFTPLTRTSVTDVCNRLNFAVYEMDGTRVDQVNQKADDSGFGTASFSLEEGEYQLVVVAHSSNGNPTMTNPAKIQFTNSNGFTDTFLYYATVTVTGEQQKLNVSLDRIVSLCRFVINDAIPEGVAKLDFYYTGGSGAFNAATGLGSVNSKQDVKFSVTPGQSGTEYDLYSFLHQEDDEITLKVTAYDASDNELYKHTIDVPMTRKKITRVSGDFFTGDPTGSGDIIVTISINAEWDGQINVTY